MKYLGVNYDVGIHPLAKERPSRPVFEPAEVRREIEIIKNDLGCNAIRIAGRDLGRLVVAAEHALDQGLSVWFAPALHDATPAATLEYFDKCAQAAETLRQRSPNIVFMAGWELTFFMSGLIRGATATDRIQVMMKPSRLLLNTLLKGSFNWRLNRFLARAVAVVRNRFKGPVTYASGMWEQVDWAPFDFVSVDCYRDANNRKVFAEHVRKYLGYGKPLIITEFGSCTYRGAGDKGGYGWAIVDWKQDPPRLKGEYVRDEAEQARYLTELFDVFEAEGVSGAFAFTFIAPKYPHNEQAALDLDMASYALVKSYSDKKGVRYPDMPWEPKAAFDALAQRFKR